MKLFNCVNCVKIVCEKNVEEAIRLAVMDLQDNMRSLSKEKHEFPIANEIANESAIYIQTKPIGEAESYEICVDDEKVFITGSDTLGTVYGIYAFATTCLHIMPTYRLTDVFPDKVESLELEPQIIKSKERQVRFRGWFINDEDLLSDYKISGGKRYIDYPYYQNVMATDVLDMILETALRLENNMIIPASFLNIDNPDEEELVKATCRRGLYISQHHVEPMGVSYFAADDYVKKYGKEGETVSFISNRSRMEEMWTYYAKKWAVYGKQVVWQFGLRGKADQAVWKADPSVPMSLEGRGQIITDAIQAQYDIVSNVLGHQDFYSTSTLWDEGSELYGKGVLKLPQNTIAVFSDFGTDQMMGEDLFNTPCRENGKYGIYYHAAFWLLGPHLTEGCRPEKMAYNYRNAAEQGKLYYSILNVSNVRPLHFSVTMNAKILENPLGVDIEEETLLFDKALFGDMGEQVHALRKAYYECFADFTEEAIIRKAATNHFYYRPYENLPFLRNAATDGQVTWYGRKILSGKVHTDRPNAKADIPELKKSAKKFGELYEKMVAIEKELPKESVYYFRQFLKYQTQHMYLITEWAIACEALVNEELPWEVRKSQGEFGYNCLKQLMEERKVLEESKWENWHRGDKKMNFLLCLNRTKDYIAERKVQQGKVKDFLLNSDLAKKLYTEVAAKLPIIDYHNHLCVADIASDKKFENITQLWVSVDPYKHRAMRILGVPEKYITGDASDFEKFEKWYGCLPKLAGNPLFDWSMMEFNTVFEMEVYPFTKSATEVWDEVNEKVRNLSATKILAKFNIEYSAPCASLIEDLSNFDKSKGICPSLRGDDIVGVNQAFVEKLSQMTDMSIENLTDFAHAIEKRLEAFVEAGCKYSDHALDDGFDYVADDGRNEERFENVLQGAELSQEDKVQLSSEILRTLAGLYAKNGFTMQLHIGAKRSTSTRLRKVAGPAGGYAAIGHPVNVKALTDLLDDIEQQEHGLPKTMLFTLNPADNAVMSILSGSYSKDGVEAVVSQGPAWWWCDHYQGMVEMLDHLSVFGVASTFVGMTTDSRSLLSFVRHDYFRRILCNWIGEKVEKGILPDNEEILSEMIRNMCYYNAAKTIKEEK